MLSSILAIVLVFGLRKIILYYVFKYFLRRPLIAITHLLLLVVEVGAVVEVEWIWWRSCKNACSKWNHNRSSFLIVHSKHVSNSLQNTLPDKHYPTMHQPLYR